MNTEEHKPPPRDRQETPALSEPYDYIAEMFARYEALRADFPVEKRGMGFSDCSARIRNAFPRARKRRNRFAKLVHAERNFLSKR